jgi:tRNA-specific adenosine deaminase 1
MTTSKISEPSVRDLRIVVYTTAIPFVGFGIMDNAILIIAGDAIDTSLGVSLGISTMCAAAIGNIISDVAGIGLGTVIEDFCANYLKLPIPNITTAQRQLRSVRLANQLGCGIGIVVGCIIGMFPLLWIDSNKVQVKKREAHLDTIFKDVISQAGTLVGAARVCLYLRVDDETNPIPTPDGKYLYIKYDKEAPTTSATTSTSTSSSNTSSSSSKSNIIPEETGITRKDRFVPVGRGIVSRALLTGESWNIVDVQSEPDFVADLGYVTWDDAVNNQGRNTKTMICVPILDSAGRPIAVLQAVNKIETPPKHENNKANDRLSQFLSSNNKSSSGTTKDDDTTNNKTEMTSKPNTFLRFTENDVQILKALASHISVSLQRMYEQAEGDEAEVRLHDTIQILKEYGLAGIENHSNTDTNNNKGSTTTSNTTTRFAKSFSNRPLFPEL